jgi:hypothetical protein
LEVVAACPEVGMAKAAPAPAVSLRNSRRFTSDFNMDLLMDLLIIEQRKALNHRIHRGPQKKNHES